MQSTPPIVNVLPNARFLFGAGDGELGTTGQGVDMMWAMMMQARELTAARVFEGDGGDACHGITRVAGGVVAT